MSIEEIERNCLATLKIEGLKPSNYGKELTRMFLEGKLTSREVIQQTIKYHIERGKK